MHHIQHNLSFCIRTKTNQDIVVKEFIASHKKDALVTFHPGNQARRVCKEKGLPITPVTLRLIPVDLPNEVEVLITNLTDSVEFDASIFKSLYFLRWGIEENYKRLMQWVEIENFFGQIGSVSKAGFLCQNRRREFNLTRGDGHSKNGGEKQ